jgi:hypothetical protein
MSLGDRRREMGRLAGLVKDRFEHEKIDARNHSIMKQTGVLDAMEDLGFKKGKEKGRKKKGKKKAEGNKGKEEDEKEKGKGKGKGKEKEKEVDEKEKGKERRRRWRRRKIKDRGGGLLAWHQSRSLETGSMVSKWRIQLLWSPSHWMIFPSLLMHPLSCLCYVDWLQIFQTHLKKNKMMVQLLCHVIKRDLGPSTCRQVRLGKVGTKFWTRFCKSK